MKWHSKWRYWDSASLPGVSCWQKNWGAVRGKILHRNREIVVGWTVGVWEHTESWLKAQIETSPRTNYKRSKNVFAVITIALTLVHLGTELLQLPAHSRARGKRRGFSPGAAAHHRCRTWVSTCFFPLFSTYSAVVEGFSWPFSRYLWDPTLPLYFFEIGYLFS